MGIAEDNIANSLTLHVARGGESNEKIKDADLYPWDLVLEEGFSRLYRGELTVLSKTNYSLGDLSGLLDKGVSLTITQKLGDGQTTRTRYLHGILTAVKHAGVFSNGRGYVFVIEPRLARLKFTRFTAPYYRKTPYEIFNAILGYYNLTCNTTQYIGSATFSDKLMFDQSGASDFDFIKGIAGLYGISFTFEHPEVSGTVPLVEEKLYFSGGTSFPLSPIVYTGKTITVSSPEEFRFLQAEEENNIWKMDSWDMTAAIGFDGFMLNASYPNGTPGLTDWKRGETEPGADAEARSRYIIQNYLFHGYAQDATATAINDDIDLILDAKQCAAELGKSSWKGGAENLCLRPGLRLELSGFYDSDQDDEGIIKALVTGSRLHHRALWPESLNTPPEGYGGEITEVTCKCMDSEQRFCPDR
jgi:hypothetical protein